MTTSGSTHHPRGRGARRERERPASASASAPTTPQTPAADLSGMADAVEEVRRAALVSDRGPEDPTDYADLTARLDAARTRVPPLYEESAYRPYVSTVGGLGPTRFQEVLLRDPRREGGARLMLDIAHTFLQNGERYEDVATDAAQEVIADLYDGFLSAEDRVGVKEPDNETIPPLVKWGCPDFGPYTWPVDATESFAMHVGVVSLPPANARAGLLAWTALGHETGGHDILHADKGLQQEVAEAVRGLRAEPSLQKYRLADYWADRIDETASDVLGILNMGPTAAAGLVGYFRGLGAAFSGQARLRADGPASDPHPADLLRGYLGARVVELLSFTDAPLWANAIREELKRDEPASRSAELAGIPVPLAEARASAEKVAEIIATTRMASLEQHEFLSIQDWTDADESVCDTLGQFLLAVGTPAAEITSGFYAAHVVAAAAKLVLAGRGPIAGIFDRMIGLLKAMHDANASWGPLYVSHPGNLFRHRGYVPTPA